MKVLCLLFLIFISQTLADKKRYDGYKVLRILTNGTYGGAEVHELADKHLADVWAANPIEGWIDVMLSPYQLPYFKHFEHKVHIEDVQVTLDEHEEDRRQARTKENVGFFEDYPTHGEVVQYLNEEAQNHDHTQIVRIGQTYTGTDIIGLQLGVGPRLIYIHCGIHAREWITVTTCCWIINQLLYEDPYREYLLSTFRWVIVPIFNIDGYDRTMTTDRLWRKNVAPNQGSTCQGTDINRNYGYAWGGSGASTSPCAETYRGSAAWSTPEAASERNWLQPYINQGIVAAYFDIHSYGAYYMSPWGFTTNQVPPDYAQMDASMRIGVAAISLVNGRSYTFGSSGRVLYLTSGSTVDWSYGDGGVVESYTIECAGSNFTPPNSWIQPIGREVWAGVRENCLGIGRRVNSTIKA